MKDKGIDIDYRTKNLQLIKILTTRKALQLCVSIKSDPYYSDPKAEYNDVNAIVGYVIKNAGKDPCRYLKANYGDSEISYEEAFINPGEEAIITRHELYGLRLFNGARISIPGDNFNYCLIITDRKRQTRGNDEPFLRGNGCKLRSMTEIQESVDDQNDIEKSILPKYQEKFGWLLNSKFFKITTYESCEQDDAGQRKRERHRKEWKCT